MAKINHFRDQKAMMLVTKLTIHIKKHNNLF